MNEITFVDKVKQYFSFLQSEYGFRVTHADSGDVRPQTDGVVEYTSDNTAVVIDSEMGSAAVWFYRIQDGRKYDLDPIAIHEYLNTNGKEKELLLSIDPNDKNSASALFKQKFLLNQPGWTMNDGTTLANLEIRLKNYAKWLQLHASLCLTGDFSQWPKFYEYKINRARADHLRLGKNDVAYVRVKDADGNSKLIKQSIFQDKLQYVEQLKKEILK